jgi:hypothetical protein
MVASDAYAIREKRYVSDSAIVDAAARCVWLDDEIGREVVDQVAGDRTDTHHLQQRT